MKAPTDVIVPTDGTGSRASELRAARLAQKQQQQQQQQRSVNGAPVGYVAGMGRGMGGGNTRAEDLLTSHPQQFDDGADPEDEEADMIYDAIDERMKEKRKNKRKRGEANTNNNNNNSISKEFVELKQQLAGVTEDQWAAIPDIGDYSLKYKQKRREDVFTPLPDSVVETQSMHNADATSGANLDKMAKTKTVNNGSVSVSNMSGLAEARGTVLGMSLDRHNKRSEDDIDPQGYLTSLSNIPIASMTEVGDIHKARLLLKSVIQTNPQHGAGWIAASRVEEAAGKIQQARKLVQEGCAACPDNEDVWLEAARLFPVEVAKTILATAVRKMPQSVQLFLKAADLEVLEDKKKLVLRKALEAIPTSVTLWKAAIELEDAGDAKILLSVAVDKVPTSVEMWLALARLESYNNAKKVLNKARKKLPAERAIWIAAAKLEESQNKDSIVDQIILKAVQSLEKHDAVISRTHWLKEAEAAEAAGAPLTSSAIVKHTISMGVDVEDRQRTWSDDCNSALGRGAVATARAIMAQSLTAFPSKKALWLQAVDLERKHGSASSLDEVLAAASERLPRAEIFWLVRAKEKWLAGFIEESRNVLTQAFAENPDSEAVWLAAVKLEWETGEYERARVLLQRARERAPTGRVYMKSALLERELKEFDNALKFIEEGIDKFPNYKKLYMMGGQLCGDDLKHEQRAREYFQRGLKGCSTCEVLWILASKLEETYTSVVKARSIFDLSRLKNPKNPELWVQAIRLERRSKNDKLAMTLMAKAIQECPNSGILRAEAIMTAPRPEQKSKCAEAIKRCPDDPIVITAVATLFATERKYEKARKWLERSVALNPDIGDSWGRFYAFELAYGTVEQQDDVKSRCIRADPKHGVMWCSISKDMDNRKKSVEDILKLVAQQIGATF